MTNHKDILNTMAADDLAPQGARASAVEQNTQDVSMIFIIIINIS